MGKAVNMMKGAPAKNVKNGETPATSTGKGGLQASLKAKAAGSTPPPSQIKNVNSF